MIIIAINIWLWWSLQRTVDWAHFTHISSGRQVDMYNTHLCLCNQDQLLGSGTIHTHVYAIRISYWDQGKLLWMWSCKQGGRAAELFLQETSTMMMDMNRANLLSKPSEAKFEGLKSWEDFDNQLLKFFETFEVFIVSLEVVLTRSQSSLWVS